MRYCAHCRALALAGDDRRFHRALRRRRIHLGVGRRGVRARHRDARRSSDLGIPETADGRAARFIGRDQCGRGDLPGSWRGCGVIVACSRCRALQGKRVGAQSVQRAQPRDAGGSLEPRSAPSRLRQAIDAGELELYFQPLDLFGTFDITVAEALLRWRQPDGSCSYRRTVSFDRRAIGTDPRTERLGVEERGARAARMAQPALAAGANRINVPRSNSSLAISSRPSRSCCVQSICRRMPGARAHRDRVADRRRDHRDLARLRLLGVTVALDDFGTGYSSLTSLEQLPLNRVKLDRSLIAEVDSNPRRRPSRVDRRRCAAAWNCR